MSADKLLWMRRCCYCGAQEEGNEDGRCKDGFPHTFLFTTEALDRLKVAAASREP